MQRRFPDYADTTGFSPSCALIRPLTMVSVTREPSPIETVAPEFPPEAVRLLRLQGAVIVEALIDSDGLLCDVRLLHGLLSRRAEWFDRPVMTAVRQWRFTPAEYLGRPVAVVFPIVVNVGFDQPRATPDPSRQQAPRDRAQPPQV